ncbi:uncharacterized protein [Miscanthus floridulus]|uniref:uncharacterized protein n=1 Tax=Miscanthus floridulus TaxID=154761 RepID=UPI0034589B2C
MVRQTLPTRKSRSCRCGSCIGAPRGSSGVPWEVAVGVELVSGIRQIRARRRRQQWWGPPWWQMRSLTSRSCRSPLDGESPIVDAPEVFSPLAPPRAPLPHPLLSLPVPVPNADSTSGHDPNPDPPPLRTPASTAPPHPSPLSGRLQPVYEFLMPLAARVASAAGLARLLRCGDSRVRRHRWCGGAGQAVLQAVPLRRHELLRGQGVAGGRRGAYMLSSLMAPSCFRSGLWVTSLITSSEFDNFNVEGDIETRDTGTTWCQQGLREEFC